MLPTLVLREPRSIRNQRVASVTLGVLVPQPRHIVKAHNSSTFRHPSNLGKAARAQDPHTSLTQILTQATVSRHLTRKDGVYYYRRRLPEHLGTDVALSLGTRRFREAEHLAEQLDEAFDRTVRTVTTPVDLRAILRACLEDALDDDTTMRLAAPPRRPVYTGDVGDDDSDNLELDLQAVDYCLSEAKEALLVRDLESVDETVERLTKEHGVPDSARKALAYGVLEARVKLLEEIEKRILGEVSVVFVTGDQRSRCIASSS